MPKVSKVQMAPEGPFFSQLVQGYWRMEQWNRSTQEHLSFAKQHVELGLTTVDHANVYGANPSCEELFGEMLKLDPGFRDELEIVSKCGIELVDPASDLVNHYHSTPGAITASVETSLRRLGIDSLDVLLIHRPDWLMDVDAVAETFSALRSDGKVRHFGVSNFTTSQFALLQSRLDAPLITNQVEINPINFDVIDDGALDQLQQVRVRPMAWSCLAGGRIFSDQTEQADRLRSTLQNLAEEVGADSVDQVIFAWVMALPSNPVAIIGSGNIQRVQAAADSLKLKLSREQWYRIWVASKGHGVP